MQHPTKRLKALLVATWALACTSSVALAESDGRVAARLTNDWRMPAFEDLSAYLNTAVDSDKENLEPKARQKAIANIRSLLQKGATGPNKARLQRRLIGLLKQKGDEAYSSEQASYNSAYDDYLAAAGLAPNPASVPQPRANHDASQRLYVEAIDVCRSMLDDNPKIAGKSDAMLQYGILLGLIHSPNAMPLFRQVVTDHPGTTAAARSSLAIAELLIQANMLDEAIKNLAAAFKAKDTLAGDYAKYRLAWLRILDAKDALARGALEEGAGSGLKTPKALLDLSRQAACSKPPGSSGAAWLCEAARDDLVFLWSQTGNAGLAKAFFTDLKAQERYYQTLERLAWLRRLGKQPAAAAATLAAVVKEAPTRPRTPELYAQVLDDFDNAGLSIRAAETAAGFGAACLLKGPWHEANLKNSRRLATASTLFEQKSRRLAQKYYAASQEHPAPDNLTAMSTILASYLGIFRNSDESYLLRYVYAESLFKGNRLADAEAQYLIVASMPNLEHRYAKPAAERMLAIQQQLVQADQAPLPANAGHLAAPVAIPPVKLELQKVIDLYAKIQPEQATIPGLKLKAAMISGDYGHDLDFVPRLEALIKLSPKSAEGVAAVRILLAFHTERKNWAALLHTAQELSGRADIQDPALKKELKTSWMTGMWEQAEALAAAKKNTQAAATYLSYQQTFPADTKSDQALAKASAQLLAMGQGYAGAKPCLTLAQTYPNSPLRSVCLRTAAAIYEQLVDYAAASDTLGLYASAFPLDKASPGLLLHAAELQGYGANSDQARVVVNRLLQAYPNSNEAASGLLLLGDIKAEADDPAAALVAYDAFIARYAKQRPDDALYAGVRGGFLLTRSDAKKAVQRLDSYQTQLLALPLTTGKKARALLASYRFFKDCKAKDELALGLPGRSLAEYRQSLQQSRAILAQKDQACGLVLRLGDPEYVVAAHYQLGAYFEQAIDQAKFTPDRLQIAAAEFSPAVALREAFILETQTKMKSHWVEGLKISDAAQRHDEWQRLTRGKLARIEPTRYSERFEVILEPGFTSHKSAPSH